MVVQEQLLHGIYRGVKFSVGFKVYAIQINPSAVSAVVSSEHPIWIQHGDQFKHKVLAQQLGPHIICPQKEAKETIEDVT